MGVDNSARTYIISWDKGGIAAAAIRVNGSFLKISDRDKKDSIRKKDVSNPNKDYLDRIMKTNVYSYHLKNDNSKTLSMGIMFDEAEELYKRNITSNTNTTDGKIIETDNKMVDYNTLHLYHLLAFQ